MNVKLDVLWWSRKEGIAHRGYWDQTYLEDVLAGSVWSWPVDVDHHVDLEQVPVDSAMVLIVVPARHHADAEHAAEIARVARLFTYCVVVLTGDEAHEFPLGVLDGITTWVQNPTREVARSTYRVLGCGYTAHARNVAGTIDAGDVGKRTYDWAFLGQVTHPRRHELDLAARDMLARGVLRGRYEPTSGFTAGIKPDDYARELASARFALAPAGPLCPDTFRLFEALELGCIPIGDEGGLQGENIGYFRALFGEAPPFPMADEWAGAEVIIDEMLPRWRETAIGVLAWWNRYKKRTARALLTDLQVIGGTIDDQITVLLPTSPTSRDLTSAMGGLERTLRSIRQRLGRARILILADGVRAEQAHLAPRYEEYLHAVAWEASSNPMRWWRNVEVLPFDEHYHQGMMTRLALREVETPLVLFVEHDTPLTGEIDFEAVARPVLAGDVNVLRFHHEAQVHPEHAWLSPSTDRLIVGGVPVIPTMQWSQRPHLARTAFYREITEKYFGWASRTFIEDVMHGVCEVAWREHPEAALDEWRIFLYAPEGSMVRSLHSDGRGQDPKYDLVYAYDDRTPFGAPTPTAER